MLAGRAAAILRTNQPTWEWNFALYGALTGSSFTRATAGSYFNSAGVLSSAASGVQRFDYDPVALSPLGYLSEMASTNLLLRSAEFDNASWSKSGTAVTGDTTVAPDGTTSGDTLTENSANSQHEVFQAITLASDTYVGVSVFIKAGTRSKAFVNLQPAANNYATVVFDLSNGTVGETKLGSGSGAVASTSIRSVGNGWYRCAMVAKATGANPVVVYGSATAATGNSFTSGGEVTYQGNGTGTVILWGAQTDSAGVGVTSYIPTAGATVTRNQDVLTLPVSSIPGWDASEGGVLVATYRLYTLTPATTYQPAARIDDGTDDNRVYSVANYAGGGTRRSLVVSGGVTQGDVGAGVVSPAAFTRTRQALGWGTSRVFFAYDGTAADGDSGALALPVAPTTLHFGRSSTASLNGALESVAYYRSQRPDSFVTRVSA